jgi:hypothetical protein
VARLDDGAAERDRQVRLADPRRAEEEDVFGLREEAAGGELANQALIDRRLEFELEVGSVVQRTQRRSSQDLTSLKTVGSSCDN